MRDRMTGLEILVRNGKTTLTEPLQDSEVHYPILKKGGGAGVRQKRNLSKTSSSKRLLPSSIDLPTGSGLAAYTYVKLKPLF